MYSNFPFAKTSTNATFPKKGNSILEAIVQCLLLQSLYFLGTKVSSFHCIYFVLDSLETKNQFVQDFSLLLPVQ